jgi:hypothetical protein
MLLVEFVQEGATIKSEVHCETLKKLLRPFKKKILGMLTSGAVVLHDNARPRTAAHTRALLAFFNWSCFTTLLKDLFSLWVTTTYLPT